MRRTPLARSPFLPRVLLGLAAGGAAVLAQTAPQPAPPIFRTEANYVRVDVYPTLQGRPLRDLTRDDFELLEDGTRQKIEQFEFVEIRGNVPQETRREPQTVEESRAMAEDGRARIFVVFLDTYHTGVAGSHRMRSALSTMLTRMLGPDDLVGFMTPEMSSKDVTLARRTRVAEEMLSQDWAWGRRNRITDLDPEEEDYKACYPQETTPVSQEIPERARKNEPSGQFADVADEMIARRREKLTLDALDDLVGWLRGVREERKAVITVTDGWRLFGPNRALANAGGNRDAPPIGIGTIGGRPTLDTARDQRGDPRRKCEMDRLYLSELDNDRQYKTLLDRANRANVTFYPIDSRGLPVFDTSIEESQVQADGRRTVVPPDVDRARLTQRRDSLRVLADATDGIAVVESNDIERGISRIVADQTSYYLLGYYSTNTTLDGRFRAIKVRVTRPGVEVRARRGYMAATEEEVSAAMAASPAPVSAETAALERALATLGAVRSDTRVRTQVAWLFSPGAEGAASGQLWAVAELDRTFARGAEWAGGARIDATLVESNGAKLTGTTVELAAGQRAAEIDLSDIRPAGDEMMLRLRITPVSGGLALVETVRVAVPTTASPVGSARLWRRGPSTGPQFARTGDAGFRRNEIVRVEVPVSGALTPEGIAAELLDRSGKVMPVPVSARIVPGENPAWVAAEVALAPLGAGDYAIRVTITQGTARHDVISAIRVVP